MLGRQLASEAPCAADRVIAVPDSANTAALGYAREADIRFEIGLIRNHYVGRTFIAPQQSKRDLDVKVKFNPVTGVLKDKRVVVVDDSIVRGTTLRNLIRLIREAGASEVHVRISSPPVMYPCFYGIDIADLVYLVDYMFTGGPPPPISILSADLDCNLGVDIADLVYLVDYMFTGGPEPCDHCP